MDCSQEFSTQDTIAQVSSSPPLSSVKTCMSHTKCWKEHISALQLNLKIPEENDKQDVQVSPNSVMALLDESDSDSELSPKVRHASESGFPYKTTPLLDEYIVTSIELGRGRFGIVRKCINNASGDVYACKTVSKLKAKQDPGKARDLKAEIDSAMKLSGHPSIVEYKEIFEDSENVHFIMEICRGKDLFALVEEKKRLSETEAAKLFRQIVFAVAHCHSKGVVHRDIKLENVLLQDTAFFGKVPKLADFGNSIALKSGEKADNIVGTPTYIAPEVILGVPYNSSVDIWGLGILLYVMLSGHLPFYDKTTVGTFKTILTHKPDLCSPPWDKVSDGAKRLVARMLSKNPQFRPSAMEILFDPWLKAYTKI